VIVYRDARAAAAPLEWLATLRSRTRRAATSADLDLVRELLVETGALESAIADAMSPEADSIGELLRLLRHATCAAGRALAAWWDAAPLATRREALTRTADALDAVAGHAFPDVVWRGVPEGHAYYALYPEAYLQAARNVARALRPERVVCIGIRGIGTSLSAAAVAGFEGREGEVPSYTVRPRGHPFARRTVLAPALEAELRAHADALFVIADEGPGLSGSSFASVCEAVAALGVRDERIVLLPSWVPDGAQFVSDAARARWTRHRKFTTSFESLWIDSGRLVRALDAPDHELVDLSAGQWRPFWFDDSRRYPAVQPQHERRKYLLAARPVVRELRGTPSPAARARAARQGARFIKFCGLGARGRTARERSDRLAAAGFAPQPLGLAAGFLVSALAPGTPMLPGESDRAMLDHLARYLAFVRREFQIGEEGRWDDLAQLIAVNVSEGLGRRSAALTRLERIAPVCRDVPAVALDGRMLPHEWLRDGDRLIKADGVDHHDDHFFPGPRDIAWDVAGTCVEFDLSARDACCLVDRYRALSGDATIGERLPAYRVAYLAYRYGYASLAASAIASADDGRRWRALADRYAGSLGRALARIAHAA
jgi:hypothetical protein